MALYEEIKKWSKEEIKKYIETCTTGQLCTFSKSIRKAHLENIIIELTSFLNDFENVELSERILYIRRGINQPKLCKNCHKNLVSVKYESNYCCSKECKYEYLKNNVYNTDEYKKMRGDITRNMFLNMSQDEKDKLFQKVKNTMQEKYGSENPMHVEELKEKRLKSIEKTYADEKKRKEITDKIKNTKIEHYGSLENANKEIMNKIKKNEFKKAGC